MLDVTPESGGGSYRSTFDVRGTVVNSCCDRQDKDKDRATDLVKERETREWNRWHCCRSMIFLPQTARTNHQPNQPYRCT